MCVCVFGCNTSVSKSMCAADCFAKQYVCQGGRQMVFIIPALNLKAEKLGGYRAESESEREAGRHQGLKVYVFTHRPRTITLHPPCFQHTHTHTHTHTHVHIYTIFNPTVSLATDGYRSRLSRQGHALCG